MTIAGYDPHRVLSADSKFDSKTLQGKSILITGGASGLGEAYMRAFLTAGAFVTFGDIAEARAHVLVQELGGDKVSFARCDTTVWTDQVSLFEQAMRNSPSHEIDVVIANAGVSSRGRKSFDQPDVTVEAPLAPDLSVVNTNLIGYIYTAKLAIHHFARQYSKEPRRNRCLIMTASMGAYEDVVNDPMYGASKFGVRGLMTSLRQTMPLHNARVNLVAPAFVNTTSILPKDTFKKLSASGFQFAQAEDCAKAVLHLASDESLNGRTVAVVSRDVDARGYVDLEADDCKPTEVLFRLRSLVPGKDSKAVHRASL